MSRTEKNPEQIAIIQLAKELSNDVCMEVRKAAASQMDTIINSLNKKYIPGTTHKNFEDFLEFPRICEIF